MGTKPIVSSILVSLHQASASALLGRMFQVTNAKSSRNHVAGTIPHTELAPAGYPFLWEHSEESSAPRKSAGLPFILW